ncbi:MAG TPA: AlpA family phage regulatory protein [Novosphingobium capsulatum]|nr:AlpA family phage regulatory protein [Novosphingobium capsulatum]
MSHETPPAPERLLRIQEVMHMTSLSRSYIHAKVARGEFPAPIKLGYKCTRWLQSQVADWIAQKL